jgi:hypothetical protein
VVAAVESRLKSIYQFSGREDRPNGAYTLNFKSPSAIAHLSVNLTEQEGPSIFFRVEHFLSTP